MRLYDVSLPLDAATPVYPGDPAVAITPGAELARGDEANVSWLRLSAHAGTHLDAPAHFFAGALRLSEIALETLIGPARVVELESEVRAITPAHLEPFQPERGARLLLKTRNSSFWTEREGFRADYTSLTPEAARYLVARGVRLVGIDYLSVDPFPAPGDGGAHHALLAGGVIILEGLDLRAVTPGRYELICLPLKLAGGAGDGAPARAVLRARP